MKNILKVAVLPVVIWGYQAEAAYVAADAFINFMNVTTTGTAEFSFTGSDYFISDGLINDQSPYVTDAFYEDVQEGGLFISSANADAESYAGLYPYSIAIAESSGNAFASSYSEMGFDVLGTGSITLSFDVSLFATIENPTGLEYADVGVSVFDTFGGIDSFAGTFYDESYSGGPDLFMSEAGVLELIWNVDGAESGFLSLETYALADTGVEAVPVPAAIWFLLSGLGGLCAVARRKK